jgi:valyl-tRNA synthetase
LWHRLEMPGKSIALAAYPLFDPAAIDAESVAAVSTLQDIVTRIRQDRAANKIDKSQKLNATLRANGQELARVQQNLPAIERLANVTLTVEQGAPAPVKLDIPLDRERIAKEIEQLEKVIANSDRQLSNEEFVKKAPEKVIADIRRKKTEYEAQLAKNRAAL